MNVYLYRLFDSHNRLLYVGCSSNLPARFASHGRDKAWWPQVTHHTSSGPYNLKDGRFLEMRAIRREHPAYNVQHNPSPAPVPELPAHRGVAEAARAVSVTTVRVREAYRTRRTTR